jgi:hypothetical protein
VTEFVVTVFLLFRVFSTFIAVLVVCGTTSGYLNHLNRMDVMESGFQDASWKLLPCHILLTGSFDLDII